LELLLAWRSVIDEHYRRRGAIIIDATKPHSGTPVRGPFS
jgi:hypothetical protein